MIDPLGPELSDTIAANAKRSGGRIASLRGSKRSVPPTPSVQGTEARTLKPAVSDGITPGFAELP